MGRLVQKKKEDQRISLKNIIFREIVTNTLIHREYTNAYPCKLTIFSGRVETVNANNPKGEGRIDPTDFSPFPKNPTIAKFFIQLGRAEELGSGVLNVSNYVKQYSEDNEASFIENDVFQTIIPTTNISSTTNEGAKNINDDAKNANDAVKNIDDDAKNNFDTVFDLFIAEAISKGIIEKLSPSMKIGVLNTMRAIYANQDGIQTKDILAQVKKSPASIDRYLRVLRRIGVIAFEGPTKTGKYVVKEDSELKNLLLSQ